MDTGTFRTFADECFTSFPGQNFRTFTPIIVDKVNTWDVEIAWAVRTIVIIAVAVISTEPSCARALVAAAI